MIIGHKLNFMKVDCAVPGFMSLYISSNFVEKYKVSVLIELKIS